MTVAALRFAQGQWPTHPPRSLREFVLLSALPGYTRAALDAEDPEWLAQVEKYAQALMQRRGG